MSGGRGVYVQGVSVQGVSVQGVSDRGVCVLGVSVRGYMSGGGGSVLSYTSISSIGSPHTKYI